MNDDELDTMSGMSRALGLLDAAEIVGKRAHISELMSPDDQQALIQTLRHCEQMITDRAYAIWPASAKPLPVRAPPPSQGEDAK